MTIKLNSIRSYRRVLELLLGLEAFLTINPYFLWETFSYFHFFDVLKKLIEISIIILFLFNQKNISKKNCWAIFSFIIIYLYYSLNVYGNNIDFGIGMITKLICIIIFMTIDSTSKKNTFKIFSKIFAISLIPALIFFIFNVLGINFKHDYIETTQAIKVNSNQHYLHYFGSVFRENIYYSPRYKQICGMFDEPGMVGTISSLLLVAENYEFKNNKYLYIVLFSGILSLSLAFYLILFISVFIKLILSKSIKRKKLLYIIPVIFLLIMIFQMPIFQEKVLERLSISNLINNNRTSQEFDNIYSNFLQSSNIFLGLGNMNPIFDKVDASSYKVLIFNFGVIGFLLIVGWYIFWSISYSKYNKQALVLSFMFLLSIYQRPWIIYLYCIVILFGGIEYLKTSKIQNYNLMK